jgi:hypothetical protein
VDGVREALGSLTGHEKCGGDFLASQQIEKLRQSFGDPPPPMEVWGAIRLDVHREEDLGWAVLEVRSEAHREKVRG